MKRLRNIVLLSMVAGIAAGHAATISGIVSNSGGTPLARIYIALRTTASAAGTTIARDTTDSTGAYSIVCDSTSGTFVLRSTDPGNAYITRNDTITLDGADKTVNIQMARIEYAMISGAVSDSASETAIAGAIVRLGNRRDTTDSDGKYSFDSVATGTSTVSVTATGYTGKSSVITVTGSDAQTLDFKLVLIQYSSISGAVKDSATGNTISGAVVRLGNNRRDTTDSAGAYSFDSVAAGAVTLSASASGYVTKNIQDTVTAAVKTLDITLSPVQYSSISGTVKDSATGNAIAGAVVRLGNNRRDTTDSAGAYSFDSVVTGAFSLTASATYYASKTITDTLAAAAKTIDIILTPAVLGSVSGTVKDSASGDPISGAIVSISSGMGAASIIDTTGADGKYLLEKITTRTQAYTVTVSATGYGSKTDTATIGDATPLTRDYLLAKTVYFPITGVVKDSTTGNPIAGAVVLLRTAARDTIDLAVTDSAGNYTVDSAFNGTSLKVTATGYTEKRVQTITGTSTDAQTMNFDLLVAPGVITVFTPKHGQNFVIADGKLILRNTAEPGIVRLFTMKGELVFAKSFPARVSSSMALDKAVSRGNYLLTISQKKSVVREKVIVR